jgi:hypothetical protein
MTRRGGWRGGNGAGIHRRARVDQPVPRRTERRVGLGGAVGTGKRGQESRVGRVGVEPRQHRVELGPCPVLGIDSALQQYGRILHLNATGRGYRHFFPT